MNRSLVAFLLVAACACSQSAPPSGALAGGAPARAAAARIDNFAQVADGIYRGAQPEAAGFRALHDLGVRTIVNLRAEHDDAKLAEPLGIDVVRIPMPATTHITPPTASEIRAFLDVVTDPARQPVFVHCAGGKDRTGTMFAVYRMEHDGWTPEKAIAEMRSFGWHETLYAELGVFVLGYKAKGLVGAEAAPR